MCGGHYVLSVAIMGSLCDQLTHTYTHMPHTHTHTHTHTQGASRPSAEELQYEVVSTEPRHKPKAKEEGKKKGRK